MPPSDALRKAPIWWHMKRKPIRAAVHLSGNCRFTSLEVGGTVAAPVSPSPMLNRQAVKKFFGMENR